MSAVESLSSKHHLKIIARSPAHHDWRSDPHLLKALKQARLIIINGEGTLHDSSAAGERLLQIVDYAHSHDIPCTLINCGWQNNDAQQSARLKLFALISARDSASALEIRKINQSCRIVPDLSIYPQRTSTAQRRDSKVLVTDSVIPQQALALEKLRKRISGDTLSIAYSSPGFLGAYRFIRPVVSRNDLQHPLHVVRLLAMRYRLMRHSSQLTTEFIKQIASAGLLISGRFHACTLALTTGTPFVAIASNTRKIENLIHDAELDSWRGNITLTPDSIHQASQIAWSPTEVAAVEHYVNHARVSAENLFSEIAKLA